MPERPAPPVSDLTHDRPRGKRELVKVTFRLDDPAPGTSETMWAVVMSETSARLENVPLLAFGFSYKDVVETTVNDGQLVCTGRSVVRGGHSTYRLMVDPGAIGSSFDQRWAGLSALGCRFEGASVRFLAVDVPPSADILAVYHLIEEGQHDGVWNFEEGHCGHL